MANIEDLLDLFVCGFTIGWLFHLFSCCFLYMSVCVCVFLHLCTYAYEVQLTGVGVVVVVISYISFCLAHSGQMTSCSSVMKPRPTSDVLQMAQMKQSLCQ